MATIVRPGVAMDGCFELFLFAVEIQFSTPASQTHDQFKHPVLIWVQEASDTAIPLSPPDAQLHVRRVSSCTTAI